MYIRCSNETVLQRVFFA